MVSCESDAIEHAGLAVLDLQHLGKYTAGDVSLRQELLFLFSEQLSQQISVLKGECQGDDWMIATHTLKGAARAVGAFQIGDTAEALEQLDSKADFDRCTKLIDQLMRQAQACKTVIKDLSQAA